MKKKLVASLAAAMVLGVAGTSFAAANPFVDVPAKHWSYDSVLKLLQAGIVDGTGDGKFQGDRVLTRYEMAQIVARAMAKEDKADATQKAELKKLEAEFADELKAIGVRVDALEKNQPNLKFAGTVDMRYTAKDFEKTTKATSVNEEYRLRLDAAAKVDDNTTFGMRLTSSTATTGSDANKYLGTTLVAGADKAGVVLDRLFLTSKVGAVKATLGAQALKLGTTNLIVDSGAYSFDGAKVESNIGAVNLAVNYGRQQKSGTADSNEKTLDVTSMEATSKIGKLNYGLGYATFKDNGETSTDLAKYQYVNVSYAMDTKLTLGSEFVKNTVDSGASDNAAWNVSVTYGDQVLAKQGQQNVVVKYYNIGENSISRFSAFDVQDKGSTPGLSDMKNISGLNVTYNYAFSKNLTSYATYVKITDKDATSASTDLGYKYIRAGVTAKF